MASQIVVTTIDKLENDVEVYNILHVFFLDNPVVIKGQQVALTPSTSLGDLMEGVPLSTLLSAIAITALDNGDAVCIPDYSFRRPNETMQKALDRAEEKHNKVKLWINKAVDDKYAKVGHTITIQ